MNQPDDELLWLAYRFSAGELSAEETQEFEARLAVDQRAREALAEAVGLSETVFALEHADREGRRVAKSPALVMATASQRNWSERNWSQRDWSKWAGWIAAGVAACVALVMSWQVFRAERTEVARQTISQPEAAPISAATDEETRLLMALLAEEPVAPPAAPLAEVEAADMGEPEFELVRDDGTTEESLEDQNATPDWLLAAVAESQS